MLAEIIIENLVGIVAAFVITLIGVFGTWLTAKIGKKTELANINLAQQEVIQMAQTTAAELQQTLVESLKAAHEDKKLTKDEIALIGEELMTKTKDKMSLPTYKLLNAAGVDINALIKGAGEKWVAENKLW